VIELNYVKIEAFPSHHLDAMRGLPHVSFILLDADFFPRQQADARDLSYTYIVMASTPNALDNLFGRIEKSLKIRAYTYSIGTIYTVEKIEKARQSSSFEREYNLKYLGKIGNVFHMFYILDANRTRKQ
jgi:hypothetical protein